LADSSSTWRWKAPELSPHYLEGETCSELRAALADLRHLEGFLASVGREHEVSSLPLPMRCSRSFAEKQALELSRIAHGIEQALGEGA
jgi:hypothetical protein